MTKSLTEQWREGELRFGFYYVKFPNEEPQIYSSEYLKSFTVVKEAGRIDILAPVPSYDKVKEMSQKIERLEFDNEALEMAHNEGKEINAELLSKNEQLEKKLKIAKKALNRICEICTLNTKQPLYIAQFTNRKVKVSLKEMEGVK